MLDKFDRINTYLEYCSSRKSGDDTAHSARVLYQPYNPEYGCQKVCALRCAKSKGADTCPLGSVAHKIICLSQNKPPQPNVGSRFGSGSNRFKEVQQIRSLAEPRTEPTVNPTDLNRWFGSKRFGSRVEPGSLRFRPGPRQHYFEDGLGIWEASVFRWMERT